MKVVEDAIKRGEKTLSESDSKKVLSAYAIPVTKERVAKSLEEAKDIAREIGYPVVLKGSSSKLTHKTELNMIELDIKDEKALEAAYKALEERGKGELEGILVQQMIKGEREFVAGLIRDPQFGPCVMFGLGGIFTEVLKDVTFRVAPLEKRDAYEMMGEIRAKNSWILPGKPAVNRSTGGYTDQSRTYRPGERGYRRDRREPPQDPERYARCRGCTRGAEGPEESVAGNS